MKEIHQLLEELKEGKTHNTDEFEIRYQIKDHPARALDGYMKEQYMMLLFSILKSTDEENSEAIRFLYYLAEKAEYLCDPEEIVKYLYMMDAVKINDCAVSFETEEIRYLLGVEFFLVLSKVKEESARSYALDILNQISVEKTELKILQGVSDVIESGELSSYPCKEYREYCRIFRCYLYKFNFDAERKLVVSNCLKEIRADSSPGVYKIVSFIEGDFISDYNPQEFYYIEKGEKLGHFIGVVGGIKMGMGMSTEKWNKYEEDESKYLKTKKFKDYNFMSALIGRQDDNSYETVDLYAEKEGILLLFCNYIDKYNLPVGVIFHPLDDPDEVEGYFREAYCAAYDSEE